MPGLDKPFDGIALRKSLERLLVAARHASRRAGGDASHGVTPNPATFVTLLIAAVWLAGTGLAVTWWGAGRAGAVADHEHGAGQLGLGQHAAVGQRDHERARVTAGEVVSSVSSVAGATARAARSSRSGSQPVHPLSVFRPKYGLSNQAPN